MCGGGVRLDVRHVDGPNLLAPDDQNTAVASMSSTRAGAREVGAEKVDRANSRDTGTAKTGRIEQCTASYRKTGSATVGHVEKRTPSSGEAGAADGGNSDSRQSGATKLGRVEESSTGVHHGSDNAACNFQDSSGGGDVRSVFEDHPDAHGDAVQACSQGEGTVQGRPLHADTPAESEALHAMDKHCHYPTRDGGCCRRQPVMFSFDLTHSEVDAFLGPTARWKDPFQVRGAEQEYLVAVESCRFGCIDPLRSNHSRRKTCR